MSEAKFKVKIGPVEFSGAGDEKWLSGQFDKMFSKAKDLETFVDLASAISAPAPASSANSAPEEQHSKIAGQTLAKFLVTTNATKSQPHKFLATAAWCHHAKGKEFLSTADVKAALKDSKQASLGNPSDCQGKNLTKGFCERHGNNEFFVTPDGYKQLDA
ncbi:MAG: hypothetical protein OD918_05965 [Gammaproteobacteria bacterium]